MKSREKERQSRGKESGDDEGKGSKQADGEEEVSTLFCLTHTVGKDGPGRSGQTTTTWKKKPHYDRRDAFN